MNPIIKPLAIFATIIPVLAQEEPEKDHFPLPAAPELQHTPGGRAVPTDPKRAKPVVLPETKVLVPLTPFKRKLLTAWDPPYLPNMQAMIEEIEAAENGGDQETYQRLTKRYTIWAEKYLRRDNPPDLPGNPNR